MSSVSSALPKQAGLGLLREEFLRLLRSREAALITAAAAYALLTVPFLLRKPHEEILVAFRSWFGESRLDLRLFLFVWFDLVMNKMTTLFGAVLAAGIITDERSKGLLDVLLAKPITPRRYFLVKLAAAAAVLAVIYAAMVLAGVLTFRRSVKGFDAGPFLLMSAVHLLAALYGVVLAGTLAVHFRHKLSAMLTTIVVLSLMVGCAFMGFYAPWLRTPSLLNPLYHGVVLIGSFETAGPAEVLRPVAWLLGFCALTTLIGARRAATLCERD